MKYTFHPHARKEPDRAVAYYDSLSQETGESFLKETSESISGILNFPEAWAKIRGEVRHCKESIKIICRRFYRSLKHYLRASSNPISLCLSI